MAETKPTRTRNYDKSKTGQNYRNQYQKEHYTRITYLASPEIADMITEAAEAEGLSKSQYITKAVLAYMTKETGTE